MNDITPHGSLRESRVRLRYTLVIEYDAIPSHYEGSDGDPQKMAALDLESVKAGHLSPYDLGEPDVEKIETLGIFDA